MMNPSISTQLRSFLMKIENRNVKRTLLLDLLCSIQWWNPPYANGSPPPTQQGKEKKGMSSSIQPFHRWHALLFLPIICFHYYGKILSFPWQTNPLNFHRSLSVGRKITSGNKIGYVKVSRIFIHVFRLIVNQKG